MLAVEVFAVDVQGLVADAQADPGRAVGVLGLSAYLGWRGGVGGPASSAGSSLDGSGAGFCGGGAMTGILTSAVCGGGLLSCWSLVM
jgi:hypothetical protein